MNHHDCNIWCRGTRHAMVCYSDRPEDTCSDEDAAHWFGEGARVLESRPAEMPVPQSALDIGYVYPFIATIEVP